MDKVEERKLKYVIKNIVPWVWLVAGYIWTIWYQVIYGQTMLDSDMSSEMILSKILNEERSISGLTTSWIYSTELRVLNMQWIYRIGLALFPHNWHMARTLSMAIAIPLLAFSVWLVFFSIDNSKLGVWAAAATIFPGGGWYFWMTIYAGHYIPYICISLFSFALLMLAIRNIGDRRSHIYICIAILLALGGGLNGVKQFIVFYAPLVLTALVVFIADRRRYGFKNDGRHTEITSGKPFRFLVLSLIISAAAFVGYLINSLVLANIYQFKSYGDSKIESNEFIEMMRNYIWSFGYAEQKKLLSFLGIASMFGVAFGILVVVSGILLLFKFKELSFELQLLSVLSMICILMTAFVLSYVPAAGDIDYFVPVVPFGYILVFLEIHTARLAYKESRFALMNLIMAILLIISIGTIYNEQNGPFHEYRAQPKLNDLVTVLRGVYTDGVSPYFWTTNIVTELSDGDIDMWFYNNDEWGPWLTKSSHMDSFPEGAYFYLVPNPVSEEDSFLIDHPELEIIYQDDTYTVFTTDGNC